ncbi:hypothetical protein ACFVGN_05645 [Streptomyces sp. NPDC057757]|uniref:hypothetical protein n=1 Tax=Streptomyces sp. NPDC057757 TaxID=3346241 RepID=UPI0036960F62
MHARRAATAALFIAATATACSSGADDKAPASAAKTSSQPSATTAAPSARSPLKVGASHSWSDTDEDGSSVSGVTTVMGYAQPVETDEAITDSLSDFPNPEWATLDIKVCADSSSSTVWSSQGPWSLGFPDDTRIKAPLVSGAGVPKPEYPVDGTAVKAGSCLRGKITFSLARGTRPDLVIYAPEGRDPIEWAVPKA